MLLSLSGFDVASGVQFRFKFDIRQAFTDSTGLDVNFDCSTVTTVQCNDTDLNNRKGKEFDITRNGKTGLLEATVKDPSKLPGGESALYNAINDTNHHATVEVVSQSDSVTFGRFDGNGHNTVDRSDLDAMNKADGRLSGETIAHEALEAYGSTFANGTNYGMWHGYPNQFSSNVVNGLERHTYGAGGLHYYEQTWNFLRLGTTVDVKTVVTPVPVQTIPRAYKPGKIVNVK